ncbi:hypothetical protein L2E82_31438 [Cichorium intybus]|uniref:Uncharacterized protein n=1 Tax=Cichorium intybus TaxID=13427 RepID=A0ACB9D2W7_CICIN|nr:hypothetical protein L2E82_31438 [Cichorium intybus]
MPVWKTSAEGDIQSEARPASIPNTFPTSLATERELERTGQPLCIYEIYNGAGAWPFLHHGSLYCALSVSTKSRSLRSNDVDAVGRLSILNESYYRDILLEMGCMFSIANRVDNVHKRPWIGFQSSRAAARKESADNVNSETNSPSKDALLEEGCKKYAEVTNLNLVLRDVRKNLMPL